MDSMKMLAQLILNHFHLSALETNSTRKQIALFQHRKVRCGRKTTMTWCFTRQVLSKACVSMKHFSRWPKLPWKEMLSRRLLCPPQSQMQVVLWSFNRISTERMLRIKDRRQLSQTAAENVIWFSHKGLSSSNFSYCQTNHYIITFAY